jgi:hypothetical protein
LALELIISEQATINIESEILVGEVIALMGVNNCATFCPHVCTAISSRAPACLTLSGPLWMSAQLAPIAFLSGLSNCLKRCKEVQMELLHAGLLEAWLPVVTSVGVGYNLTGTPSAKIKATPLFFL